MDSLLSEPLCIDNLYQHEQSGRILSGPTKQPAQPSRMAPSHESFIEKSILSRNSCLIRQPDSQPISQSQLAAEVKGIASGLGMLENKCVRVANDQTRGKQGFTSSGPRTIPSGEETPYSLKTDCFQELIALHRTLLHAHHDFFHASQHPSAGPATRDPALRYSMPTRTWKHGIHNFLELLRHQLPNSLDYMLAFIYLAYQVMALRYEAVDSFEETWFKCLGDLGRYRTAIEDEEDLRDREVWTGVARFWYTKAVDKNPGSSSVYHHLAILAKTSPLKQLSSYCSSLTATQPFMSSRKSILALLKQTLTRCRDQAADYRSAPSRTLRASLQSWKHAAENREGVSDPGKGTVALSRLYQIQKLLLSLWHTNSKLQSRSKTSSNRLHNNLHGREIRATLPLMLIMLATLPLAVHSRRMGTEEHHEAPTTWKHLCSLVVAFLVRRIPISFVALIAALTYTWLILQSTRPPDESVRSTFQSTWGPVILVGLSLANLIFMGLQLVSLNGFEGHRRPRNMHFAPRAHWTALQSQDMYVLRVITMTTMLFAGLLAKSRENFTPHMALTWVPVFWSISTLINAGWRRDESPLDVEVGPESDE